MPFRSRGPRNDESARDAVITPNRGFRRYPRNAQSQLDMRESSRYKALDPDYLRAGIEARPVVTPTGTFVAGGVLESEIVTGGETIIFTVAAGFEWAATLGSDNALTTAFLAAITGTDAGGTGWNDEVTLVHGNLVRTSATIMTLTTPASASYQIPADEIITAIIPDGSFSVVTAPLTVTIGTITEDTSVALTGTAIAGGVLESEIVTGSETVIYTVTGDTWVATIGDDNGITTAFLAGITGDDAGANGFDDEVALVHGNLVRTSATILTLTLPAAGSYSIAADETISSVIPATAFTNKSEPLTTATFDVTEGS